MQSVETQVIDSFKTFLLSNTSRKQEKYTRVINLDYSLSECAWSAIVDSFANSHSKDLINAYETFAKFVSRRAPN